MLSTHPATGLRKLATQLLNAIFLLTTAFMLLKSFGVIANCSSPIVVVLSESMKPAMLRGDLIVLWNRGSGINIGDIVVYHVEGRDIPIVHRVIRRFGGGADPLRFLTNGDNNIADDTELYAPGQEFLSRGDVAGSVIGCIPYVGYITIAFNDFPWLKTLMVGLVGLSALIQRG
ncbi:Signal peptidase complex catalytic subunit [Paraphaeosphaeria sporulosa]|uniref:Signal peptidase complex catalytic subunit SEC11 n=1 Tax=Paraphaeosphaeria sporulosa TaxID=1460663 RepID=A0A177C894_9PLEO|nr:signal peptidase complex catalytic subunit sec11 [Paraphaeosphaeria sporulosa]OAG03775.1 signal peptidase complex catalytic subunit sec11 [Paraphaeosphaeria sporulosa]